MFMFDLVVCLDCFTLFLSTFLPFPFVTICSIVIFNPSFLSPFGNFLEGNSSSDRELP